MSTFDAFTAARTIGGAMSTTATITNVCQIAEDFGRQIGLARFDIDRIIRVKNEDRDEWLIHVQFGELDPLLESDDHGAMIVVDVATEKPRLIRGL